VAHTPSMPVIYMFAFLLLLIFWIAGETAANVILGSSGFMVRTDPSDVVVLPVHVSVTTAVPLAGVAEGVWFAHTSCMAFVFICSQNRDLGLTFQRDCIVCPLWR
jgi:hypothetical protein